MIGKLILIMILQLFFACDFSSRLYKQILIAQEFILEQKFRDGVKIYEEILKEECPQDIKIKIYFQLGEIYSAHFFDNKKAIYYFEQIKKISKDPLWNYKSEEKIADINFSYLNNFKDSIQNYKNLTTFLPQRLEHDLYEYRLGMSYLNDSKQEEAIKIFEKITKKQKHKYYNEAYDNLGMAYFQKKEWAKAIEYWDKYILLETKEEMKVKTKFLIANSYEVMEDLKKAYDIYYSILGQYPNTEVIRNRLNAIYERKIARRR